MKKGFTLIEVIISIAIFSIAMVAISMAYSTSLVVRQMNDTKQSTSDYSQAIIEKFRALGITRLDSLYSGIPSTGVSGFVYFNSDMSDPTLQSYCDGTAALTGSVVESAYPLHSGKKFGALIKVTKTTTAYTTVPSYHIYVRVWKLDKGAQSQSVKDIYESR